MHKPNLSTISITDLTGFSECRRQWWLSEYYEPKKPAPYYWVGSVVHAGLEGYYKNGRSFDEGMKSLVEYAEKSLRDLQNTFDYTWDAYAQEFDELYILAKSVFQNYCVFDYTSPIEGDVFKTEQYLKVPLLEFDGKTVFISGRVDLQMMRGNQLWVVDHKTAKSRESSYAGLDVDEQLTGYAWLAWKTTGILPTAVLYNILIKDIPDVPRRLKDGSLSKDKSQSTVFDLYLGEIQRLGLDVAPYSDILTYLQNAGWSRYFSREGSIRNERELLAFEARATQKVEDILCILIEPDRFAYPSPATSRCGFCPFIGVCKSMDDGSDYQAILDVQFLERAW